MISRNAFLVKLGYYIADFHADGAGTTARELMNALNPTKLAFIVKGGIGAEYDLVFCKVVLRHDNPYGACT